LKKHPDLQNVALLSDLVTNKLDKQALAVQLAPQLFGRPFAMGPDVPDDRFKAMRKAFWDVMHYKKFLAAAKKRRLPIDPASGEEVQKLIETVYSYPPEVIARAKEIGQSRGADEDLQGRGAGVHLCRQDHPGAIRGTPGILGRRQGQGQAAGLG
jgi:hypothetical protein